MVLGSLTVPLWYPLWQVSHNVIRFDGLLPPVLRLSIWCTLSILSLDLPWQHWHSWPSLKSTYSRTFQKSSCSPCWYSASLIAGFLIFWISKDAVSTMIFDIGSILCIFAATVKCVSTFCLIEGASQPSFLVETLLLKRGFLYLVLRFLRDLRFCRLVESRFTISFLSSTSAS